MCNPHLQPTPRFVPLTSRQHITRVVFVQDICSVIDVQFPTLDLDLADSAWLLYLGPGDSQCTGPPGLT